MELAAAVSMLLDTSTPPRRMHLGSFFECDSGLATSSSTSIIPPTFSSTAPLPIDLYSDGLKDAVDGTMKDVTERHYAPVVVPYRD